MAASPVVERSHVEVVREWRRSVVIVPGLVALLIDGAVRLAAEMRDDVTAGIGSMQTLLGWVVAAGAASLAGAAPFLIGGDMATEEE